MVGVGCRDGMARINHARRELSQVKKFDEIDDGLLTEVEQTPEHRKKHVNTLIRS